LPPPGGNRSKPAAGTLSGKTSVARMRGTKSGTLSVPHSLRSCGLRPNRFKSLCYFSGETARIHI
jgi:hypothetical protein